MGTDRSAELNLQQNHQSDRTEGPDSMNWERHPHGGDHSSRNPKEVPIKAVSIKKEMSIDHVRQRKRPRIKAIRMAT